eukprot:943186-Rhodomonas_salina.2
MPTPQLGSLTPVLPLTMNTSRSWNAASSCQLPGPRRSNAASSWLGEGGAVPAARGPWGGASRAARRRPSSCPAASGSPWPSAACRPAPCRCGAASRPSGCRPSGCRSARTAHAAPFVSPATAHCTSTSTSTSRGCGVLTCSAGPPGSTSCTRSCPVPYGLNVSPSPKRSGCSGW